MRQNIENCSVGYGKESEENRGAIWKEKTRHRPDSVPPSPRFHRPLFFGEGGGWKRGRGKHTEMQGGSLSFLKRSQTGQRSCQPDRFPPCHCPIGQGFGREALRPATGALRLGLGTQSGCHSLLHALHIIATRGTESAGSGNTLWVWAIGNNRNRSSELLYVFANL